MRSPWGLAAIMAGYAFLLLAGLAQVLDPEFPPSGTLSDALVITAGVLLLLGSATALACVPGGWWRMERVGLFFITLGLLTRAGVTGAFLSDTPLEAATRSGLALALVCFLSARVAVIWGVDLDPTVPRRREQTQIIREG